MVNNARIRSYFSFCYLILAISSTGLGADWPHWRGPTGDGVAPAGPPPPLKWDEQTNIVWKTSIPGRGHGSPTVMGDRIYLATAELESQSQSVIAIDRNTGNQIWKTPVFTRVSFPQIHAKNTHASATVACDGKRLYMSFYGDGKIRGCALDLDGNVLWRRDVGPFRQKYEFGYAASPVVVGNTVIITCEAETQTSLVALDVANGKRVWRANRKKNSSYSSPALLNIDGRQQLLMSGNREICSYDPQTGKELWRATGAAKHTAGTVTGEDDKVIASGGYPQSETFCVQVRNGSPKVLWRNNQKCYEQSMLMHDGYVYAVNDAGIAFCWNAATGDEQWKKRLSGPVSVSPILVNDRIYVSNEKGTTYVFAANPKRYVGLGRNQLGTSTFATPAFLDGQIFTRVASGSGSSREETLYCIGLN